MVADRKLSILLHPKDSPFTVHSGYSAWGKYISKGLKDAGWDLAVYAPVGVKYNIFTFDDIDCYPGSCALPNQDVLGNSNIETVVPRQPTFNADGEMSMIERVFRRPWNGTIISIKPRCLRLGIKVTPEHRILVLRGVKRSKGQRRTLKYAKELWVPASEVRNDDWVCTPILTEGQLDFGHQIELSEVKDRGRGNHLLTPYERTKVPKSITLCEDLAWLFGVYFADGSSARGRQVRFSFNYRKEQKLAERARDILQRYFKVNAKIVLGDHNLDVATYSCPLARTFKSWFGPNAHNKQIPLWLLNSKNRVRATFLKGVFDGDGCETYNGLWKGHRYPALHITTSSRTGAISLFSLLVALGFRPTLRRYIQSEKAYGRGNTIYCIVVLNDISKLGAILGLKIPERGERHDHSLVYNGKLWFKISEIKQESYQGDVFDLTVKEKNSYALNGVIVHNSEGFGENLVDVHLNRLKMETGKEPLLLQIADCWPLTRTYDLARQGKIRFIITPPVDWIPPTPQYMLEKLSCAMAVVPWTKYGQDMLQKEGLKNVRDFIPLGVNTNLFRPLDRSKFPETMRSLGFEEDTFNLVIISANQFLRKPFYEWFMGIKMFMDANPNVKTRLYVHSPTVVQGGYNLADLAKYTGIDKITNTSEDYAHVCGDYDEKVIVRILAMADCLLMGGLEGFGLPTIEAQAVGTPVIGLNVGATAELVKSGILVPPKGTFCVTNLLVKALPHEKGIADALQVIHESPRSRWKSGIKFVRENFDWKRCIIPKWVKLLEDVENELDRRCEIEIPKPSEVLLERAKEIKVIS